MAALSFTWRQERANEAEEEIRYVVVESAIHRQQRVGEMFLTNNSVKHNKGNMMSLLGPQQNVTLLLTTTWSQPKSLCMAHVSKARG